MKKNNKVSQPIERYNPDIDFGLTTEQLNIRKNEKLFNKSEKQYSKTFLSIVFGNLFSFFNLLGLLVTVALIYAHAPITSFFFDFIYIINIFIGIFQETRAKLTIDKLSLLSSKTNTVIRNGLEEKLLSKEIVLDDIILLQIGDQIPTDCVIKKGVIEVNESLLTGESVPVKKQVGDKLFAGSYIISGTCTVQAVYVGKDNYIEQLSEKAKKYKKPHSEIMSSLHTIIKAIGFVIVPIAALYIAKALLNGSDIKLSIIRTSTVVIGMIPSGMFLLTSVALAVGVIKLAKHNTLVQDLYSLEMLARVDTVCFDKTGTITDGRMSIKEIIPLTNESKYSIKDIISSMMNCLRDTNQTATALYEKFGYSTTLVGESIMPFDSQKKLSAVTFKDNGTYALGAPEFILSKETFKQIEHHIIQYASLGLRVILLAHSDGKIDKNNIPESFSPISLILINDNIRKDAIKTVQWFKDNDVTIKVISGDNPMTVAEVSRRVGIENADKFISLEGMNDSQVFEVANKYTVFGRVSPDQKAILIKAMKLSGHVTAMTGDGVNDILAMKESDCAITVASGSEAARNVANLVLTDNNFDSMPKIVCEGRRVINNVQSSSSLFLMKTFFTAMLSILILCIPDILFYPFKLEQMLIFEVCIIGMPSFFLSLQPNEARVKGHFMTSVFAKSLPSSILMVLSVILTKAIQLIEPSISSSTVSTMEILALNCAGIFSLLNLCKPFNKYRIVLFTVVATVIASITLYTVAFGINVLYFTSLLPKKQNVIPILYLILIFLLEFPISLLLYKIRDILTKKG